MGKELKYSYPVSNSCQPSEVSYRGCEAATVAPLNCSAVSLLLHVDVECRVFCGAEVAHFTVSVHYTVSEAHKIVASRDSPSATDPVTRLAKFVVEILNAAVRAHAFWLAHCSDDLLLSHANADIVHLGGGRATKKRDCE